MRSFFRRDLIPQWILALLSPAYRLLDAAGNADFLASLWSRGLKDVITFIGEWGWIILTPLGLILLFVAAQRRAQTPSVHSMSGQQGLVKPWWEEYINLLLESSIDYMLFHNLWKPDGANPSSEPSLFLYFKIRNSSPNSIVITGVSGQLTINGVACNSDAKFIGGSRISAYLLPQRISEVIQPLQPETGREILGIIERGESLVLSAGNLSLTGTIEGPDIALKIGPGGTFIVECSGISREHAGVQVTGLPILTSPMAKK